MLLLVCTDGVVRIGGGGGVTRYDDVTEIAGARDVLPVPLDMTVDRAIRALDSVGRPWWARWASRLL